MSSYDHIFSDEIEVDDLADMFREVLDGPVLFERFGLQSMLNIIEEDDV